MLPSVPVAVVSAKLCPPDTSVVPFEVASSIPPCPVCTTCTSTSAESCRIRLVCWSTSVVASWLAFSRLEICWSTPAISDVSVFTAPTDCCTVRFRSLFCVPRLFAAELKSAARLPAAVSTACRSSMLDGSGESWLRLLKKLLISAPMPEVELENCVCICCNCSSCVFRLLFCCVSWFNWISISGSRRLSIFCKTTPVPSLNEPSVTGAPAATSATSRV